MKYYRLVLSLSIICFASQFVWYSKFTTIFFGVNDTIYPFSLQNFMWAIFVIGILKLEAQALSIVKASEESQKCHLRFSKQARLTKETMDKVIELLRGAKSPYSDILSDLSNQFKNTSSVDSVKEALLTKVTMFLNDKEVELSILNYLIWLIPTLGFLGTVYGISIAIDSMGNVDLSSPNALLIVTAKLAVAFHTTLVSLALSSVLVFFNHKEEYRRERFIQDLYKKLRTDFTDKLVESAS